MIFFILENNKSKKHKISSVNEGDNTNDESSSSTIDNDDKKKKSKHSKKSKKKEKHINEISGRELSRIKSAINPDDISDISEQKILMRSNLNDNEKNNNDERISRYEINSFFR